MGQNMGRLLRRFFHPAQELIDEHQSNADLAEFIFPFAKAVAKLQQATAQTAQQGMKNPLEAGAAASDYLKLFALVVMAQMWLQMVIVAHDKLENGGDQSPEFYKAKIKTARFFFTRMLPEADGRFKMVMAGAAPLMDVSEDEFESALSV